MDGRSMCALADQELASFLSASELETAHHRMCKQENKCGFGLKGLCCRLCSNGPCRITKNADRGVCGATADVIAAREFLRAVAAGSAAYLHLTEQAAMRLARMAAERKPLPGTAGPGAIGKPSAIHRWGPASSGFPHCQGRAGRSERLLRGPDAAMGSSDREGTPE